MKLTVVLTVYNKEAFLQRALDALCGQQGVSSIRYEILAVNDGSTDGSLAILQEYAKRDRHLRIITQSNQGLSMARNNGVASAQGEYIWFVDADDTISIDAVSLICETAQKEPDVIPVYARTNGIERVRNQVNPDVKTGKDILLDGHWEHCGVFNVCKRAFLLNNGLRFMAGIYHEDAEYTPRMLYAAQSVRVIPRILYTVYRESNSIMTTPYAKRAFDCLTVAESLSRFVKEKGESGTRVGRVMDGRIAVLINNGMAVILQHNITEQTRFNQVFFEKREWLLRPLEAAPQWKYRLEAQLFKLFPMRYVAIYKLMQKLR